MRAEAIIRVILRPRVSMCKGGVVVERELANTSRCRGQYQTWCDGGLTLSPAGPHVTVHDDLPGR